MKLFLIGCYFAGCNKFVDNADGGLSFIEVSISGDPDNPDSDFLGTTGQMAFSPTALSRTISVQVLDRNAEPYPFNGDLKLDVRPGKLADDQDPWVTVEDGKWSGNVDFKASFGPTRIWASEEGSKDAAQRATETPSFATGVSEEMNFAFPTIREMNNTLDVDGAPLIQNTLNHLVKEFTEVRVADRTVLATHVGTNGFWVADIEDYNAGEDGGFASMYIYTFQKPGGVQVGSRITKLVGGNQEYLGSTQLSFPAYEVEGVLYIDDLPQTKTLSSAQACDDHRMESFEAAKIRLDNVIVDFDTLAETDRDVQGYYEYGQWPVHLEDDTNCRVYIDSSALTVMFNPIEHNRLPLEYVQGIVTQVYGKWVIVLTTEADLPAVNHGAPRNPQRGAQMPRAPQN